MQLFAERYLRVAAVARHVLFRIIRCLAALLEVLECFF
jgi:hypothetical protein